MIEELTKTYGTKSRVLEQAIETLLRVERVGSCEDCIVKTKVNEQANLRKALDLTSVGRKTVDSLLEVAIGDKTFQEFIAEQKGGARNTIEILKGSTSLKTPTNFKDFVVVFEEIQSLTRLFEIASRNEIENTVILRPHVFRRLPEIVAFQLAVILEGLQVPFDIRVVGEDVAVKLMRQELYSIRKKEFTETFNEQIEKRLSSSTPGLFRGTLILVGPAFMNWAEKHLEEPITDLGSFIEDLRVALGKDEFPAEPAEFVRSLLSAFMKMNWFKQAKVLREVDEKTLELSFQTTTPSVAKLSLVMLSVVLATRGWKLLKSSVDHMNVTLTVQFIGVGDQSLLDQVVEISLFQTVGKQFLDVVPVPREVMNSFASKMYETDKERFSEVYRDMGTRVASAIRLLAREDREKAKRLSQTFIMKNLASLQPDAEIRFVDDEHFTMIFKKIDFLVIHSQRVLVESIFKELGYEISTTVFQNLLSFKLKRLEKPLLEPVPRKKVMQNLIGEMSANSCDEAFELIKEQLDQIFPEDYPWTIREVGDRLLEIYRELGIEVGIEYFEGGFTLKYRTCPYYQLVKSGQKTWLCNLRKRTIDYVVSRVSHGKKGKIKIVKSLLKNEHPCEYAVFLTGFLEGE
ncbi:MAG: hypothetical protein QHH24_00845 [Candidatus Bathyarchaeota archaeon]|nr:hypothetical protein [Candidatus Bathyarchaeota archaeon]